MTERWVLHLVALFVCVGFQGRVGATKELMPVPTDPLCLSPEEASEGEGWLIPVMHPIVVDKSADSKFYGIARTLQDTLYRDLALSGVFYVLKKSLFPSVFMPMLYEEETFDYFGFRDAGAYMVVVVELSGSDARKPSVRTKVFLTEEGTTLKLDGVDGSLDTDKVERFAHGVVNALQKCFTGVYGNFGSRIAFALKRQKKKEIYVLEFGSGSIKQVSSDGELAILPTWVPGGLIAYTGYRRGNPDLYIVDPEKGKETLFSSYQGFNSGVSFDPKGRFAAISLSFDDNPDIYLVDGSGQKILARLTDSRGIDISPCFSPDGEQIAFVSDRLGGPQIFLMDKDGMNQHPLPLPGSYNTSPDFSPDGHLIAYQSRGEDSRFSVWVYDRRNGQARRLSGGHWDDEKPSFSPDGRLIVFTSTRLGRKLLFLMNRDGSYQRPLVMEEGEFSTPSWEKFFGISQR